MALRAAPALHTSTYDTGSADSHTPGWSRQWSAASSYPPMSSLLCHPSYVIRPSYVIPPMSSILCHPSYVIPPQRCLGNRRNSLPRPGNGTCIPPSRSFPPFPPPPRPRPPAPPRSRPLLLPVKRSVASQEMKLTPSLTPLRASLSSLISTSAARGWHSLNKAGCVPRRNRCDLCSTTPGV